MVAMHPIGLEPKTPTQNAGGRVSRSRFDALVLTAADRAEILDAVARDLHSFVPDLTLAQIKPYVDPVVDIVLRSTADRVEPYQCMIQDEVCDHCAFRPGRRAACPMWYGDNCVLLERTRSIVTAIDRAVQAARARTTRPTDALPSSSVAGAGSVAAPTPRPVPETERRNDAMSIKRILVAVDDIRSSARLLDMAAELAEKTAASVALVHVINPPLRFEREMSTDVIVVEESLIDNAKAMLAKLRRRFGADTVVGELVREGKPVDQIVAAAREWKADLIVVGDRKYGAVTRFLLGSTADGVVRRAPCPVLVVRPFEHDDRPDTADVHLTSAHAPTMPFTA
jgi:universal stress protein A